MEIKIVIKGFLLFIINLCFFSYLEAQNSKICILFNPDTESNIHKIELDDRIVFYMDSEVFEYTKNSLNLGIIVTKEELEEAKPQRIDAFLDTAFSIRKRKIAEDDENMEILKKGMYFDTIYLYEVSQCEIYKYLVEWKDDEID